MKTKPIKTEEEENTTKRRFKVRGDHCLNIFVTFEMKEKLRILAERYDRTVADIVRAVLKIGVPMMEGISVSEEMMLREYMQLFRKFRKIKSLKEI
jgi:predicted DNA-binding protein